MIGTAQKKFGIFGDIMGEREDIPHIKLSKAYSTESENVFLRYGAVRGFPGRLKDFLDASGNAVQTPDTNPIIRYHRHVSSTGTEYEYAYTKAHVYRWRPSNYDLHLVFTCGSDCTLWSTASFNGKIISTNNIDKVQVCAVETDPDTFADLDSVGNGLDLDGGSTYLTAAKYVFAYEGYIHFSFTTEGGTVYPYRWRWCSYGDETDYDETGSGDTGAKDFFEGSDRMMGFGLYSAYGANILIVFKEKSSYQAWLVDSADVFNTIVCNGAVGLLAPHSIVNDKKGHLYYMGSDYTIRKAKHGIISQAKDRTVRRMNPTAALVANVEASFLNEYNLIVFAIPGSTSSTGNDKIICYDLTHQVWHEHTFPVRCFGDFSRQNSYTIDTIPFSSIDGIDWEHIDSVENIAGWLIDLCSDYSGYTFDLHASRNDAGSSYTRKLVLGTDYADKAALAFYKRTSNITFYFVAEQSEGSVANVYAKEDRESGWELLGEIDLTDAGDMATPELPVDLRFRYGEIKIEAINNFELLGVVFDYEFDGD